MTHLRRSRDGGNAAGMARAAIIVDRTERRGFTAVVMPGIGLMLVLVVAEMLSGSA